jgi:hypothetical protein
MSVAASVYDGRRLASGVSTGIDLLLLLVDGHGYPRRNPATPAVGKAGTPWPVGGAPSCLFSSSSCLYAGRAQAEALLPLIRALLPLLRG